MNSDDPRLKQVVKEGYTGMCRDFSAEIAALEFSPTKNNLWVRRFKNFAHFIHFHRRGSSYGGAINASIDIRVHFGIRPWNSPFPGLHLNGPLSDAGTLQSGRYHLRFNAASGSTRDRCLQDLVRFVREVVEPWFQQFETPATLLNSTNSPLTNEDRSALEQDFAGRAKKDAVLRSLKLLGIKGPLPSS